ncbi:hypothetical protein BHM03_00033811 [Ensete ventricosum]|nr:hypothetical protein BHM03_00033811 [Ensete ventricosum]
MMVLSRCEGDNGTHETLTSTTRTRGQMLRDTKGQIIERWMRISRNRFYRKVAGKHGVPVASCKSIRRI